MSQYGDGDYCAVYDEEWRAARKDHVCSACDETIAAGHRYHRTFTVFEGLPGVTLRCERCQAIFEHLNARICREGDSEEFCDAELNCGHEYKERWGEPPPEGIAALAFWRPGDKMP
jgi:hypothetical protein